MAFHENSIRKIVQEARESLELKPVTDTLTAFGGHEHRILTPGSEEFGTFDLWNDFLRVTPDSTRSMVFRVLTRPGENIQSLTTQSPHPPRIALDVRTNMERELEPMTQGEDHLGLLMQAYFSLANGQIDAILTPVREGSLGPVKARDGRVSHTTAELAYNPQVWDLEEEIEVASALYLEHSYGKSVALNDMRRTTQRRYQLFARHISEYAEGITQPIPFALPSLDHMSPDTDWSFFSDEEVRKEIPLFFGPMTVDQVVTYPYPTPRGTVYVRLFRVWSPNMKDFEVVRVVQTKQSLSDIDGLRIDSSCVDGVHSLDCHCDCKVQLEEALYDRGLDQNKNIMVIMMADHEGKAMGTVNKGATHRIAREYNARNLPGEDQMDHLDSAEALYSSMNAPADARRYGAAQAVIKFLGVTNAKEALMDNEQKISSLRLIGFSFLRKQAMEGAKDTLPPEARHTLESKKVKVISGLHGQVIYTGETSDGFMSASELETQSDGSDDRSDDREEQSLR